MQDSDWIDIKWKVKYSFVIRRDKSRETGKDQDGTLDW